jgi:hypothetical protein
MGSAPLGNNAQRRGGQRRLGDSRAALYGLVSSRYRVASVRPDVRLLSLPGLPLEVETLPPLRYRVHSLRHPPASKEQPWDRATLYALALKARENNQVRYAEHLEDIAVEAAAEADWLVRSARTSEQSATVQQAHRPQLEKKD